MLAQGMGSQHAEQADCVQVPSCALADALPPSSRGSPYKEQASKCDVCMWLNQALMLGRRVFIIDGHNYLTCAFGPLAATPPDWMLFEGLI